MGGEGPGLLGGGEWNRSNCSMECELGQSNKELIEVAPACVLPLLIAISTSAQELENGHHDTKVASQLINCNFSRIATFQGSQENAK